MINAILAAATGVLLLAMVALWRLPAARPRIRSYDEQEQP